MSDATQVKSTPTQEREGYAKRGWIMLPIILILFPLFIALFIASIAVLSSDPSFSLLIIGTIGFIVGIIGVISTSVLSLGFFSLQPNEARVMVMFGEYHGTIKKSGFYWANPFYSKRLTEAKTVKVGNTVTSESTRSTVSLRTRTLNGAKLKVNDKTGNPIEIASVVIWRVVDTAKAIFDVNSYQDYVATQAESALRHVASVYAYDHNGDSDTDNTHVRTLRSNIAEVSQTLKNELSQRLEPAGIVVEDARLTHLAYAPEIAQVMLRRQQAEAIIAARTKIVQGAVSMVDMALKELDRDHIVALDEERKAAMVSNLLVVLCGDKDTQPIVNTGTLYN